MTVRPRITQLQLRRGRSLCSLVQPMLTDIPGASVRPSSALRGHLVLRSCAHGGTRIGTGACGVGGHQARPCGQPGWPASRTARRCRRAWPCIGAHRAPVRRGGWTPSSAAVAKFGRLSHSRASHLQSYSPAGAHLGGGSTAGHTTGSAQGEERPSWWSVVARHGRHRHCCGRRRNRTPALSDLTVFKTAPVPHGFTFQCGDGRI